MIVSILIYFFYFLNFCSTFSLLLFLSCLTGVETIPDELIPGPGDAAGTQRLLDYLTDLGDVCLGEDFNAFQSPYLKFEWFFVVLPTGSHLLGGRQDVVACEGHVCGK